MSASVPGILSETRIGQGQYSDGSPDAACVRTFWLMRRKFGATELVFDVSERMAVAVRL